MFSEKPHCTVLIRVHLVHQRISIFGKTCCENDELKIVGHDFEEIVNTWSLLDIYAAYIAFNVHRDDIMRIFDLIKLTVYQSFIQIKNQCF